MAKKNKKRFRLKKILISHPAFKKLSWPSFKIMILVLLVLSIVAIVIGLIKETNIASMPQAAEGCTYSQCKLPAGGCQARGHSTDGYICLGANRWKAPDNNIFYGSLPALNLPSPLPSRS